MKTILVILILIITKISCESQTTTELPRWKKNIFPEVKDLSYVQMLAKALGSGYLDNFIDKVNPDDFFVWSEPENNKFNHLHGHKYSNELMLNKCVKFHESELVWVDLSRMEGRWDRHLMSIESPVEYEFSTAKYEQDHDGKHGDQLTVSHEPNGYKTLNYLRNETKQLKSYFVLSESFKVRVSYEESVIAVDYNSFILKYICIEMNGFISESLHLQLRPQMTAELKSNLKLFSQILDSIHEKSINKIKHLIPKLFDRRDKNFAKFGQKYNKILIQRLEKYQNDNQLSDKSDDKVFQFLSENCLQLTEEELILDTKSKTSSSNWTLDYTDISNEKILFNRMTVQSLTDNSFTAKLFKGNIDLVESDIYYDINNHGYWVYTEGMRSLEFVLYSTKDQRVVYSCEERQREGKLSINEKMRFFSLEKDSESELKDGLSNDVVLDKIKSYLKHKNLEKIIELQKNIKPLIGFNESDLSNREEL